MSPLELIHLQHHYVNGDSIVYLDQLGVEVIYESEQELLSDSNSSQIDNLSVEVVYEEVEYNITEDISLNIDSILVEISVEAEEEVTEPTSIPSYGDMYISGIDSEVFMEDTEVLQSEVTHCFIQSLSAEVFVEDEEVELYQPPLHSFIETLAVETFIEDA